MPSVMQEVRKGGRMMLMTLIQKTSLFRRLLSSSLLFCRISQIRLVLLHPTVFIQALKRQIQAQTVL